MARPVPGLPVSEVIRVAIAEHIETRRRDAPFRTADCGAQPNRRLSTVATTLADDSRTDDGTDDR
jgi:hypothetical protein